MLIATIGSLIYPQDIQMNPMPKYIIPQHKETLAEQIIRISLKYQINPKLIFSIIQQESKFNSLAISKKGAVGLMQLMPKTAKWLKVDRHHPEQNLDGGIRYLAMQLRKYKSVKLALAAYNAGPGNVDKYNKTIPPFKQTEVYIKNICSVYQRCEHFSSSIISG